MSGHESTVPIEEFIKALTTQLDHAQTAMAVKAKNLDLPLTFAVKDLSLDLRAHVEVVRSEVRIRPAGPGDKDTSLVKLSLTTITKPMIEENALPLSVDDADPSIKEAVGDDLSDEEQRRLEWAGVRTVGQLRRVRESGAERTLERVASLPVDRLRRALQRASTPFIANVSTEAAPRGGDDGPAVPLLRIRGHNLMERSAPRVTIAGDPVRVMRASPREVLVAPEAHQLSGTLRLETDGPSSGAVAFELGEEPR
jgi:hypothetical protein